MNRGSILRRVLVGLIGLVLVVAGLVAVPLPVLPGWAIVIAGLLVLSTEFEWAHRLVSRLKARLDRLRHRPSTVPLRKGDDDSDIKLSA